MSQLQFQEQQLSRRFTMYGKISEKMSREFRDFANLIMENDSLQPGVSKEPIHIFLNTGGGYCNEGNAIISTINDLQKHGIKINIHTEGLCMSMGVPILLSGDTRTADINTSFMIHGASCGTPPDYIDKGIKYLEFEKKMSERLDNYIISRSNITKELLDEYNQNEMWFTYEKALELGLLTQDIYAEQEMDEEDICIKLIKEMSKEDLIKYITNTQGTLEDMLDDELGNKKPNLFTVNMLENSIDSCITFLGYLNDILSCTEIEDMFALAIYDLIAPSLVTSTKEGDAIEE